MALTAINQVTEINNQKFYSRPCRFESNCANYNPALTIPVVIRFGGKVKTLQKLNSCTHGGGCACSNFVRIVENAIYLQGGLR